MTFYCLSTELLSSKLYLLILLLFYYICNLMYLIMCTIHFHEFQNFLEYIVWNQTKNYIIAPSSINLWLNYEYFSKLNLLIFVVVQSQTTIIIATSFVFNLFEICFALIRVLLIYMYLHFVTIKNIIYILTSIFG